MVSRDPGNTGRRRTSKAKAVKAKKATNEHTMSVPAAGKKYFNLSKNSSYKAAAEGLIPTIRVGKLLKVPVRRMERQLEDTR